MKDMLEQRQNKYSVVQNQNTLKSCSEVKLFTQLPETMLPTAQLRNCSNGPEQLKINTDGTVKELQRVSRRSTKFTILDQTS